LIYSIWMLSIKRGSKRLIFFLRKCKLKSIMIYLWVMELNRILAMTSSKIILKNSERLDSRLRILMKYRRALSKNSFSLQLIFKTEWPAIIREEIMCLISLRMSSVITKREIRCKHKTLPFSSLPIAKKRGSINQMKNPKEWNYRGQFRENVDLNKSSIG